MKEYSHVSAKPANTLLSALAVVVTTTFSSRPVGVGQNGHLSITSVGEPDHSVRSLNIVIK